MGTIAYGYYVSPDYNIHPGEYMPPVGTRTGTPLVQGNNRIFFTLFLPSGQVPASVGRCRSLPTPDRRTSIRRQDSWLPSSGFAWHCHARHQQRG